jgi:hypothetical protein
VGRDTHERDLAHGAYADAATRGAFARHFGHHSVQNHNTSAFSPRLSPAKLCPSTVWAANFNCSGTAAIAGGVTADSDVSSHYGVVTAKSEGRTLSIADI